MTLRAYLHEFVVDVFTTAHERSKSRPAKRLALDAMEEAARAAVDELCDRLLLDLMNDPDTKIHNGDNDMAKQLVGHMSPQEAIATLVSYFRGSGDHARAFHALVDLLVMARDFIDPHQPVFGAAGGPDAAALSAMSDEQLAAKLEECGKTMQSDSGKAATAAGAFPWQLVLSLAFEALKRWLDSRT